MFLYKIHIQISLFFLLCISLCAKDNQIVLELKNGDTIALVGATFIYQVTVDGKVILKASAATLAAGIESPELLFQENLIRQSIIEKNQFFFHSWRPQKHHFKIDKKLKIASLKVKKGDLSIITMIAEKMAAANLSLQILEGKSNALVKFK